MSKEIFKGPNGTQVTPKESFMFMTILMNLKDKPDPDWNAVAEKLDLKNVATAKVRFGQIKKKLGYNEDGSGSGSATADTAPPKPATPRKRKAEGATTTSKGRSKKAKVEEEELNPEMMIDLKALKAIDEKLYAGGEEKEENYEKTN